MTKRRLIVLMAIPVALATILAAVLYTAMHTSAGAGWILTFLQNQLPGELKITESEGDFASGLVLHQTSYTEPELSVQAARIRLAISLELFPLAARIDTLAIQSLNVKQESDEPGQSSPEEILASLVGSGLKSSCPVFCCGDSFASIFISNPFAIRATF